MENVYHFFCNSSQYFGVFIGGPTMIIGFLQTAIRSQNALQRVLCGAALVSFGLAMPSESPKQLPPVDSQFLSRVA